MNKMERKAKTILEAYQDRYEEEIRIEMVIKNNDTKYLAFIVGNPKESHMRIRMDEAIGAGESVEDVVEFIHQSYVDSPYKEMENFTSGLLDFEAAKDSLFVRLLNTEKNKEHLENVIKKTWYNLSMVLCVQTTLSDGRVGSIQVPKELLNHWKKSVDEIFEIVLVNAEEKFPMKPTPLSAFMSEIGVPVIPIPMEFIYICNNFDTPSAAGFLYPSNLKMLEPGDYIIPSSTEECLIVKASNLSPSELVNIVQEVNHTVVEEESFLADNMYEYAGDGKFIVH